MKTVEILGGIRVPVSEEEKRLWELCKEQNLNFNSLPDRGKQLAMDLYLRNIVLINEDGDITINGLEDIIDISW